MKSDLTPIPGTGGGADSRGDAGTRREFLVAGAVAATAAVATGAAAQESKRPPAEDGGDPGPTNAPLTAISPNSYNSPPTDHGTVPNFWASYATAHRRIQQNGAGWTRQIANRDLTIATEIAGVNMRLVKGGIRELHWHVADEWAIMLAGKARVTVTDYDGKGFVDDIEAGDLWFFPGGAPHSIQGTGDDGCEFLLVFNDGNFSEDNTTLISEFISHVPRDVLAKNFGVAESDLARLPGMKDELYIFPAELPGPLEADRKAIAGAKGMSPSAFTFKLSKMAPTKQTRGGAVRVIDKRNFPVLTSIAAAHVTVKPGGLREIHWHPNADEWQYYILGQGRMTLFINNGNSRTMDFRAGDIGYVPRSMGHYIENTGDTDLVFIETFKADTFQEVTLNDWISTTPPALVMQHLKIGEEIIAKVPSDRPDVVPR